MRTKEEFVAQFTDEVLNIEALKGRNLVKPYIGREEPYPGVKMFCALNKVLIQRDNGRYYMSGT